MAGVFVVGVAVADFVFSLDEMPRAAEKYRAKDAVLVGGGCAANAAVAIARLGGEASLAARLGSDVVAEMIMAELEAENVDTRMIDRAQGGRSSFSSVYVDRSGERQIVNFRGDGLTNETGWLENAPEVACVLTDTRWSEGAAVALELANKRGIPGIVDAEAPMDPAVLAKASHIAFSRQGLLSVSEEEDLPAALEDIRSKVSSWACVTDGANGVYFTSGRSIEHIRAFEVEVRDTLAAGDVWHGAFALRLSEGAGEAEAITFANAAAGLKCMKFGGRSGCPGRDEVEQFLEGER